MVVVFPASMWAMMPILRVRLSGVWRGIATFLDSESTIHGSKIRLRIELAALVS